MLLRQALTDVSEAKVLSWYSESSDWGGKGSSPPPLFWWAEKPPDMRGSYTSRTRYDWFVALSEGEECSWSISEDLRTLAFHVLAYVGFQKSYPFNGLAKSIELLVLPPFAFRIPFLPAKWKQIGLAVTAFRKYMSDEFREEERLIAEREPGSGSLMGNFVRAPDWQGSHVSSTTVISLCDRDHWNEEVACLR